MLSRWPSVACRVVCLAAVSVMLLAAWGMGAEEVAPKEGARGAAWTLKGTVTDARRKPVPGAVVVWLDPGQRAQRHEVTADAKGKFQCEIPAETVYVLLEARDEKQGGRAHTGAYRKFTDAPQPVFLQLQELQEKVVDVVDARGRPVEGAEVEAVQHEFLVFRGKTGKDGKVVLKVTAKERTSIVAFKSGVGYDYFKNVEKNAKEWRLVEFPGAVKLMLDGTQPIRLHAIDAHGDAIPGVMLSLSRLSRKGNPGEAPDNFGELLGKKTDEKGVAEFDWFPPDFDLMIGVSCLSPEFSVRGRHYVDLKPDQSDYDIRLARNTVLSGRVVDGKGEGVPGVRIEIQGQSPEGNNGYTREISTRDDGKFEVNLPGGWMYGIFVRRGDDIAQEMGLELKEGQPVRDLELRLERGTVLRGMTVPPVRQSRWSVERKIVSLSLKGKAVPEELRRRVAAGQPMVTPNYFSYSAVVDAEGKFRFVVGPGRYELVNPDHRPDVREVTVTWGMKEIVEDLRQKWREVPFRGTVVDPEGNPLKRAIVRGYFRSQKENRETLELRTNDAGVFEGMRRDGETELFIASADGKSALVVDLWKRGEPYRFELQKTATVKGRLVDQNKEPRVGELILARVQLFSGMPPQPMRPELNEEARTNEKGEFAISGLPVGGEWLISHQPKLTGNAGELMRVFVVEPGEIELGEQMTTD